MKRFALLAACATAIMSACTNGGGAGDSTEQLTVRWQQGGPGMQRDHDMVIEAANEILREHVPNTEIEMEIVHARDFRQAFDLLMAAGEPVDIAWMSWTQNLREEVRKGSYLPLDDLLAEHGHGILSTMPDFLLEVGKIDGVQYIIPKLELNHWQSGLYTSQEMFDAAFDLEQWQASVDAIDNDLPYRTVTTEMWDAMEGYMARLDEQGLLGSGFSPWLLLTNKNRTDLIRGTPNWSYSMPPFVPLYFPGEEWDFTVLNIYEQPQTIEMFERFARWREMGYIREDMLSLQNPREFERAENNGYAIWFHGYNNPAGGEYLAEQRWADPHVVIPLEKYTLTTPTANDGMVIPRTAQDPARSMQVLNLLISNEHPEFYNTLVWGLEDVHFRRINENRIETLHYRGQGNADSPYGQWKFAFGNVHNSYLTQTDQVDTVYEYYAQRGAAGIQDPFAGYAFDDSEVVNELAQVRSVLSEYVKAFMSGFYEEAIYREFMERLEVAGVDRIMEESQIQVDAFLESRGIPKEGYVFTF